MYLVLSILIVSRINLSEINEKVNSWRVRQDYDSCTYEKKIDIEIYPTRTSSLRAVSHRLQHRLDNRRPIFIRQNEPVNVVIISVILAYFLPRLLPSWRRNFEIPWNCTMSPPPSRLSDKL